MKNGTFSPAKAMACLLALLIFLLCNLKANAQILITIDASNPTAVVFIATGAAPSANGPNVPGIDGIDFLQFFTTAIVGYEDGNLSPSTLAPFQQSTAIYHSWNTDTYSGSNVDLNIYSDLGSSQHFNTTDPAFIGSATIDFSAYAAYLPSNGATGEISDGMSGNASGPSRPLTILGTWKVVPEPSICALLGFGVMVLLLKYIKPMLS